MQWQTGLTLQVLPAILKRLFRTSQHLHIFSVTSKFNKSTLFVEKRKRSVILGEEIKRIKAGDTYVIDLAKLPTLEEQSLVVGDVMRAVDEMYSARNMAARSRSGGTAAKYLLIFIDEINRFLPSSVAGTKRMSAAAEQITRTVITGKSR
jgi:DNA helicase HerA-like ATPase